MTTMDLLYTEVEEDLRASVRRLLAERAPATASAQSYDRPTDFSPLWNSLSRDLGVAGLLVSEADGGSGAGIREAAVVAEEIGRAVAPVPFLTSSVIAVTTLRNTADHGLLARLASGEMTAALAAPFADRTLTAEPPVIATSTGLIGSIRSIAGLELADVLLVPIRTAAGIELHVVPTSEEGVVRTTVTSLDMTRAVSDVRFCNARSTRLEANDARLAVDLGLQAGAAVLASEQLGLANWCFDATLEYVKQRYQFGRPIGSFQALKHRLADLWVEIGNAGAAARYAADVLARHDSDAAVAVAVAQSYCSSVAVLAAEECIQMHGGIGMTWEYPAHLYLKRAKADEIALGTPFEHRTALASLVDLPPA